jgi:class 3 adenylate cyclase
MNTSYSPQPEEGRRLATVMLINLQGIASLADSLDLTSACDVVKQVFSLLDELIQKYAGYLFGYIGDSVVAVWGVPVAGDNDAEQAVRAALALDNEFRDVKRQKKPDFENLTLRVSIDTGSVLVVGVKEQEEFTLIGNPLSITSRLAEVAGSDTIVISENTFRRVRGVFQIRRLSPVNLTGQAEPISAFTVENVQASSGRARYGSIESLQTCMVGRATEMATLEAFYKQSFQNASPTMVIVTGEDGIGKSRLLMEFTSRLEAANPAFYLMSARALSQTARVPFYLWKLTWHNRFGLVPDDSPQTACDKFLREVQRVWGRQLGPVPAIEAAHLVGSLVGLELQGSPYLNGFSQDPLGRIERAFDLTRELLRRICAARPTALVLDDLQWADEDSLDLLAYLLKSSPNDTQPLPLFILAGARTEFLDNKAETVKNAQLIHLEPLPANAEIVASIYPGLGTLPSHILATLEDYSGGNPYFLEEIVRSLMKSEEEVNEAALYETLALLRAQPPESLQAMLQTRLEDLSRIARAAAMLASVVGRVFWVGAIETAVRAFVGKHTDGHLTLPSGLAEQSIQEGLHQLVRAELAFPRANSTYSSEQEYIFKHDLLREVAYNKIPTAFRDSYHLAVGHWLVARSDPDFKIMAADNFEAAGSYSDAVRACEEAAQIYQLRGATGEAHRLLERAHMIHDRSKQES